MSKFVIQGGKSLKGEISVGGAKNAAMKMMAAALLTDDTVYLENVPDIKDIRTMKEILENLGAKISFESHHMELNCQDVKTTDPDYKLVKHMRGSVVILGPLIARYQQAKLPQPGGCLIGSRPIDTHLKGFTQFGVKVKSEKDFYLFDGSRLKSGTIVLEEMSVTATENMLMLATLLPGRSQIHLAASEPEIIDLAELLIKMGAKIKGAGTSVISVEGVGKLHGASHEVIPDRIEAGTFAIAAAVSRGKVIINNVIPDHLEIVLNKLREANVTFEIKKSSLHIKPTTIFNPINFDTRPYPGFPTDLQAPMSVLLTQANGTSRIFETMYEGRLAYITELNKMGANAMITDAHTAVINGPTPLYGKEITSFDIRAGATLIIAALIAQGTSTIDRIDLVDRGYERIEERLNNLGAQIKRI